MLRWMSFSQTPNNTGDGLRRLCPRTNNRWRGATGHTELPTVPEHKGGGRFRYFRISVENVPKNYQHEDAHVPT